MSNVEFEPYAKKALNSIQENIDALTERYVTSADPPATYIDAIAPLLLQQIKLLEMLKAD